MKAFIIFLAFLLFVGGAWGLAQEPPSTLDETLEGIVHNGIDVSYTPLAWSSQYNLPQSYFSVDTVDFYDNAIDFSGVAYFALGLSYLQNPQLADLDLNQNTQQEIVAIADRILPFVWTPEGTDFGTHHKGTLPNSVITNVVPQVQGIYGPSNVCHDIAVAYNAWGVPESTTNALTTSNLDSISGIGTLFLLAANSNTPNKQNYITTATNMGNLLLSAMVTPPTESFGIHPEQVMDDYNNSLPVGMLPREFTVKTDSPDSALCTDGGTIKVQENEKTQLAFTAIFFDRLHQQTKDERYQRAKDYIIDGILSLQECDGSFRNYSRWEGPGTRVITCTPSDGSAEYEPYPSNATLADTRGLIQDNAVLLYLLQLAEPNIYDEKPRYRTAVQFLLELEEKDIGNGFRKNGSPLRYASYSLPEKNEPFARLLLSNVFLQSSCRESSSDTEKRLQAKAYNLMNASNGFIQTEIESKIAKAVGPNVGPHFAAIAATANSWKIISKGCEDCVDVDGDGFIDGACAGDTVKYDCNENDNKVFPGATEICDLVDNDCDGHVDDGFDADNDGVSVCANDCNDNDDKIYPGAKELLDEKDNDCNEKADDTGIVVRVMDDLNNGIPDIQVRFVTHGNACVNSFAQRVENIPSIVAQCKIEAECTTDLTGTCLGFFEKNGEYEAIAAVGNEALFSDAQTFIIGNRIDLNMQTTTGVNAATVNGNGTSGATNATQASGDGSYLFLGLVVILLVIAGVGVALFYRMGKMPRITLNLDNKPTTPKTASMPARPMSPPASMPRKVDAPQGLKKEMPAPSAPAPRIPREPNKPKWKGSDKTMPKESQ
ncbi:MAG: putative metal-binding motif-containing protein [Candidatus Iainarchaeum archaeon]|uniref:Putative metal-binding motif-containing protein n=1 Tax=Candidatus Iainarchaeum sp. TaxID=3101447 RepID=A0A7T9DJF5_9ARCH|nr:MAG: putative metal-binding motif-containing protein [Candidatus Diapherotrites archaeon]